MKVLGKLDPTISSLIFPFLNQMEIFFTLSINKKNFGLVRSSLVWNKAFLSAEINPQRIIIYLKQGIKKKLWDFLSASFFIDFITQLEIENIIAIGESTLVTLMKESQRSAKLPYLIRAKTKKKAIEEKVNQLVNTVQPFGFEYLKLPADDLHGYGNIDDEIKALKILQALKKQFFSKYSDYQKKIMAEKHLQNGMVTWPDFISLYFRILFWDKEFTQEIQKNTDLFYQLTLAEIQNYRFSENSKIPSPKPNFINGLQLACEMENFHALEGSQDFIKRVITMNNLYNPLLPRDRSPSKSILLDYFFEKILANSASQGHEAVMQFLYEQGVKSTAGKLNFDKYTALQRALKQTQFGAAMLAISHEESFHPSGIKELINDISFSWIKFRSFFILHAYQIEFDKNLLLETIAKQVSTSLRYRVEHQNVESKLEFFLSQPEKINAEPRFHVLPSFLEFLRLLLILGYDPNTMKAKMAKELVHTMINLGADKEDKNDGSNDLSSLKKISFFHHIYYDKKYSDIMYGFGM